MIHTINGKKTVHGMPAHFTDQHNQVHAAIITGITPKDDGHVANLHVLHDDGTTEHVKAVPHHAEGAPHTWNHLPIIK